jgi:hypothetical protein
MHTGPCARRCRPQAARIEGFVKRQRARGAGAAGRGGWARLARELEGER